MADKRRESFTSPTGRRVVAFEPVTVVAEGYPLGMGRLVCNLNGRTMTFHPAHILPGSTIQKVGDVGTLVLPQSAALTLGLL